MLEPRYSHASEVCTAVVHSRDPPRVPLLLVTMLMVRRDYVLAGCFHSHTEDIFCL